MSLEAVDWALREVRGISPIQKLILICLADQAGPNGTCWSSQSTVAEYSGLSRETINRSLSKLEKRGIIRSLQRQNCVLNPLSGLVTETKTYVLNLQKGGAS
ncbi:MAG: helix-turn-helix domain-containing protein [Leptospirillum sp.]|jgi:DNA-binding MarR family transcriptional regulator